MSFDPSTVLKEFDASALEALVETMVLAAHADGELSEVERRELEAGIGTLAKGTMHEAALSGAALAALLDEAKSLLDRDGRAKRIEVLKGSLPSEHARTAALGLAIAVTAADDIVRTSERELILDLADGFAVDRDVAADLVMQVTRG